MSVLDTLLHRFGYTKGSTLLTPVAPVLPSVFEKAEKESMAMNPLAVAYQKMNASSGIRKASLITMQTLRRMSRANWVDRTCIFTLRDEITGLKWDIAPTDPKQPYSETFRQYLIHLLKKPNTNRENWRTFIDKVIEDILVVDAGCVEKVRNGKGYIAELYHVDGATIKPIYDENGKVGSPAYLQYLPGQKESEPVAEFDNEDLIYMMWNPQGAVDTFGYGMSPVEAGLTVGTAFLYAEMYNLSFFRQNTIPPVIINMGEEVPATEVDKFRAYLAAEMMGPQGVWQPLIMAGGKGFDIKELMKSPADMQMKEYVEWQMKWKVALYRMSPQDIGFNMDQYKVQGDTQLQLSKNKAINSLKGVIKEYIDTEIIMDTGWDLSNANLEFTWIDTDVTDPQVQANVDKIYLDEGVVAINDIRRRIGEDPIKGGQIPMKTLSGTQTIPIDPSPIEESENDGMRKSYSRVSKALGAGETEYDYQSTQLDLPKDIAANLLAFSKSLPQDSINTQAGGREPDIHVTVLYGLANNVNPEKIAPLAENEEPIDITLGKISCFEGDEYDVLKVDVQSSGLHRLHTAIKECCNTPGESFPVYHPHITLAYVKKGSCKQFEGDTRFEGTSCTINALTFSNNKGEKKSLPLGILNSIEKSFDSEEGAIISMNGNETAVSWMDDRGVTQPLFVADYGKKKGFLVKSDVLGVKRGNVKPVEQQVSETLRSLGVNTPEVKIYNYDEVLQLLPKSLYKDFTNWISLEPPYNSQSWRENWGNTRKAESYIVTGYIQGRDFNDEELLKDMSDQPAAYSQAIDDLARIWLAERQYKLGDRKRGHYIVTTNYRGFGVDYTFFDDIDSWKATADRLPAVLKVANPVLFDMFKAALIKEFNTFKKARKIRDRGDFTPMPQIVTLERKFATQLQKGLYAWYKKAVHTPNTRRRPAMVKKQTDFDSSEAYVTNGEYVWQNNVKHPITVLPEERRPSEKDFLLPLAAFRPFWQLGTQKAVERIPAQLKGRIKVPKPTVQKADYRWSDAFADRPNYLADEINSTLKKRINSVITRGIDSEETYNEIAMDIQEVLGVSETDSDFPLWRAEMIARTESQWALNEGMRQQYKEIGVSKMNIIPAPDACDDCMDAVQDNPYDTSEQDVLPVHPNCRCDWAGDFSDLLGEGDDSEDDSGDDMGKSTDFEKDGDWVTINGAHFMVGATPQDAQKYITDMKAQAIMQIEGVRDGIGTDGHMDPQIPGDPSIPKDIATQIRNIDTSTATTPLEASKMILEKLPADVGSNSIVVHAVNNWGHSMQMVMEYRAKNPKKNVVATFDFRKDWVTINGNPVLLGGTGDEKAGAQFSSRSSIKETLYHGSPTKESQDKILQNGFKTDQEGTYGDAVYFTRDKGAATMYGDHITEAKVNVNTIKTVDSIAGMFDEASERGISISDLHGYYARNFDALEVKDIGYIAVFNPGNTMAIVPGVKKYYFRDDGGNVRYVPEAGEEGASRGIEYKVVDGVPHPIPVGFDSPQLSETVDIGNNNFEDHGFEQKVGQSTKNENASLLYQDQAKESMNPDKFNWERHWYGSNDITLHTEPNAEVVKTLQESMAKGTKFKPPMAIQFSKGGKPEVIQSGNLVRAAFMSGADKIPVVTGSPKGLFGRVAVDIKGALAPAGKAFVDHYVNK